MTTKPAAATRTFVRSLATGILLSMLASYLLHVFGEWKLENYRPDPDTTSSLIVYNTCAAFGDQHILRPNNISSMSDGVDEMKFTGSFMNFFDGHIPAMILLSLVFGGIIFLIRRSLQR